MFDAAQHRCFADSDQPPLALLSAFSGHGFLLLCRHWPLNASDALGELASQSRNVTTRGAQARLKRLNFQLFTLDFPPDFLFVHAWRLFELISRKAPWQSGARAIVAGGRIARPQLIDPSAFNRVNIERKTSDRKCSSGKRQTAALATLAQPVPA